MRDFQLPPGPRLPSALAAWLWTFRYAQFTQAAHRRYGPTFTIKVGGLPKGVVTIDRDVIGRLYSGDPLTKRHANDLMRPVLGERSVLLLEPPEHLARRRLVLPPFHGERVRGYAELMQRLVDEELERWRPGEVVRIQPFAQALTLEVILRAVFGISDGSMRHRLTSIFERMLDQPGSSIGFYFPKLSARSSWNLVNRTFWRLRDELDGLLLEQIATTRADPDLTTRDDILAMLVLARDENGDGLADRDLVDELLTLVLAGHETTATSIAWGLALLAHNPQVLARSQAAADDGDEPYLDALVKEILRLRSPLAVTSARHVLGPFAIGPYTVGPQHSIVVNAHGVHRDPDLYPDPEAFRPERFLDQAAPSYGFLTFGGGAHRCIGVALALLEMKVVLGAVLRRFDLTGATAELPAPVRRGTTLAPADGGPVRVARERVPGSVGVAAAR